MTPTIRPTAILDLRPTQFALGMREVEAKRLAFRARRDAAAKGEYLGDHQVPVVVGPKGRLFLVDHHHESLALHLEGVRAVFVTLVDDVHQMDKAAFWRYMQARGYCRPYDQHGDPKSPLEMPRTITELRDDVYRSLAGEARRAGAIAKSAAPFSEFLVADHLRSRIDREVAAKEPKTALRQAIKLLKSKDASFLPGWSGPSD